MRNKFNKSLHYQRATSHPRAGGGTSEQGRKWSTHWETSREQWTFLLLVLQHHLTAKLLSTHHLIITSSHHICSPSINSSHPIVQSHLISSHFTPLNLLISSHLPSLQLISSPLIPSILTICYHPISSAYLTQTSRTSVFNLILAISSNLSISFYYNERALIRFTWIDPHSHAWQQFSHVKKKKKKKCTNIWAQNDTWQITSLEIL